MATPTKAEILARAKELYAQDCFRNGCSELSDVNPEYDELAESGYLSLARSMLMRDSHRSAIESKDYVDFPQEFDVDLQELYQSNGLVLGSRGTGKSDLGMMICDRALQNDVLCYVIDPSKDWITRGPIPNYTEKLAVTEKSTVFDVSLMSPNEQRKAVEIFCKSLFESQVSKEDRTQVLVIFEESHTYFYQGSMRSKNMANCVRLLSVGRNFDCACLLISQFPSMLDKFAIKHSTSQMWFGYSREPNDVEYLRKILGDNTKELSKLNDGEFLYLTRKSLSKIAIEPYQSSIEKHLYTQIIPNVSELRPIEPLKPKSTTDITALLQLGVAVMGIALLALALA